jgi:bifunctional non-homologous end joining protein LigD
MRPPEHVRPMLAVGATELPRHEEAWAFELKWDGIRAVAHWDGRRLRFETRNLRDVTVAYPELEPMGKALGATPLILDGEVVALDDQGRPSFQLLQERMHVTDRHTAARRAGERPVLYAAFDLLHCGDETLMPRPFTERRACLEALSLSGRTWATSPSFPGEGAATYAAAEARGFEGVVAKRLDSPYLPGSRSPAWTKVKATKRDEFVVGGWLAGEGNREGRIGALLVGLPDGDGRLTYCGGVGTGFTEKELRRLEDRLAPLVTSTSPFTTPPPRRDAVFVRPEVVVDVGYRERTTGGILRQPSYKGERMDKGPADVETGGHGGARSRG